MSSPCTHNAATDVRIVDFEPRWRDDFANPNIEWLQRWFVVEPHDHEVLGNLEQHILADGGLILFAVDTGMQALGTVALKHDGDGVYARELALRASGRTHDLGTANGCQRKLMHSR